MLDLVNDPDGQDRDVINWLTVAVNSRRTTPRKLLRAAERRHFNPRRALIVKILGDVTAGARSPLEIDYLDLVERAHGLPEGRRQQSRRGTEVERPCRSVRSLPHRRLTDCVCTLVGSRAKLHTHSGVTLRRQP